MDYSMKSAPMAVTRSVQIELIDARGQGCWLAAELVYDAHDPFAVTATFHSGASPVTWTFARELLIEGLREPSGDGDVHVWPCLDPDGGPVTIIELNSPAGEALIQVSSYDVSAFVRDMTQLVPLGTESNLVDVDAMIEAIFASL